MVFRVVLQVVVLLLLVVAVAAVVVVAKEAVPPAFSSASPHVVKNETAKHALRVRGLQLDRFGTARGANVVPAVTTVVTVGVGASCMAVAA